ncbi:MAG: YhcH/YjgK/YiaL family protein [Lentisphaerota bacterium]
MILDHLENNHRYLTLHPSFAAAFRYLQNSALAGMAPGKYEIDGPDLYVIIGRDSGRGRELSPLEAHRKYIDIQYVISGGDVMGWKPLQKGLGISQDYDEARDIQFFREAPDFWMPVSAGQFAVFFPCDAHAPLAGDQPVFKAVVKVRLA